MKEPSPIQTAWETWASDSPNRYGSLLREAFEAGWAAADAESAPPARMSAGTYPTPAEWRNRYRALPDSVRLAIYDRAHVACPECAARAVPVSWAVVAAETMREEMS